MERRIFHKLVSLDEARRIVLDTFKPAPLGVEEAPLLEAQGRVLAEDLYSQVDVPPFDRALMDGYAVRAEDTFGADEAHPAQLKVIGRIKAGDIPSQEVGSREAVEIATGAPLPRGANAVVMVEYTSERDGMLQVYRPVSPGENVMSAGSDLMIGERALRRGTVLGAREIAVLAALGVANVKVYRKPRVAIFSTGDELQQVGEPLKPWKLYDVNTYALAAEVRRCGCQPIVKGILPDDYTTILTSLREALKTADVVLVSGGTSAGAGDLVYRALESLGPPGILIHGLSIKPGKPTVVASAQGKPVFGLPGYPVSALMVFVEVVEPLLLKLSGLPASPRPSIDAVLSTRLTGAKGRRWLVPVSLVKRSDDTLAAYPLLAGSGAITSLAYADGYFIVPESADVVEENSRIQVKLFKELSSLPDLVFIGSHCLGADMLLSKLEVEGYNAKVIYTGSLGGVQAIKRGEADVAGLHLLDEKTLTYNIFILDEYELRGSAVLVRGYTRVQGIAVAKGNPKNIREISDIVDGDVLFINRVRGTGTRVLFDYLLKEEASKRGLSFEEVKRMVKGYRWEAKTHSAVAAAIAQGRADAGITLKAFADKYGLDFIPLQEEHYDFLIKRESLNKPAVQRLLEMMKTGVLSKLLSELPGYKALPDTGEIIS